MGERRRKRLVQREMEWKVSCERLSLLTNYLGLLSSLEHLVLPSPPPLCYSYIQHKLSLPLTLLEIPVTTAARICVSLIVSFSYPLQANPARRSVLTLLKSACGGHDPSLSVYRIRYTMTTVI